MNSISDPKSDFRDVDSNDEQLLIAYLDALSEHPDIKAWKKRSLELLSVKDGTSVLDVGSGTGYDCWYFASKLGSEVSVTGVDSSKSMIKEAQIRYGLKNENLTYVNASAEQLPFGKDEFSAVHCERLLCHLPTPDLAIEEMIRVAKPGGRVVITEADYGTTIINSGLVILTERLINLLCMGFVNHRIGRQLAGTMAEKGLENIIVETHSLVFRSLSEFDRASGLTPSLELAVAKGVLTENERSSWLADLMDKDSKGQFFTSTTFFTVSGEVSDS